MKHVIAGLLALCLTTLLSGCFTLPGGKDSPETALPQQKVTFQGNPIEVDASTLSIKNRAELDDLPATVQLLLYGESGGSNEPFNVYVYDPFVADLASASQWVDRAQKMLNTTGTSPSVKLSEPDQGIEGKRLVVGAFKPDIGAPVPKKVSIGLFLTGTDQYLLVVQVDEASGASGDVQEFVNTLLGNFLRSQDASVVLDRQFVFLHDDTQTYFARLTKGQVKASEQEAPTSGFFRFGGGNE